MISTKNCKTGVKFLPMAALLGIIAVYPVGSYADVNDKAALQQEFDQKFTQMMNNPADIDITMQYANLAVQLENYEAAIPALERILLFNPDLPRVKAQLGVMYFNLNSFEMAKSYLTDAKKGKNVPQDVVAKADEYLGKIK
jgi:tetratricopeptide (TPR) repeat protein